MTPLIYVLEATNLIFWFAFSLIYGLFHFEKRPHFFRRLGAALVCGGAFSASFAWTQRRISTLFGMSYTYVNNQFWYACVLPLTCLGMLLLVFKLKPVQALFLTVFGRLCEGIDYGFARLIMQSIENGQSLLNTNAELVSRLVLFALNALALYAFILWSKRHHILPAIRNNWKYTLFLLGIFACFMMFDFIFLRITYIEPDASSSLRLMMLFLVSAFALFFLCVLMGCIRIVSMNEDIQGLQRIIELQNKHNELHAESLALIHRKQHDIKRMISAFKYLNAEDRAAAIEEAEQAVLLYGPGIPCGSQAFSSLLAEKKELARANGILIRYDIQEDALSTLDIMDGYIILSNVLDNAIEACGHLANAAQRVISLRIRRQRGLLMLDEENYYSGQLQTDHARIMTIKEDKENHGFGIQSIEYAVNKHNGMLSIETDAQTFRLRICMPDSLPQRECDDALSS